MSLSEVYDIDRMKTLLTSNMTRLTRIPTNMRQHQRSWIGGKQPIRISTVRTDTINGNIFSVCSLCRWYAREGGPYCTHAIESNHGSKNGRTHLARMRLYKRLDHNWGCRIVLTYDPQSSTPQYPAGHWSGLVPWVF